MNKWEMPNWMEQYRGLISNTGGSSVERLMNLSGKDTQGNVILAGLAVSVDSQITLLCRLKKSGFLKESKVSKETKDNG